MQGRKDVAGGSRKVALAAALAGGQGGTVKAGQPLVQPSPQPRPRVLFSIDATASRQASWDAARQVTDSLFPAPGELDVALAVHSGGKLTTFTSFTPDLATLRDAAAGVRCVAGPTRMLDVLSHAAGFHGVRAVIYVGDDFEEDREHAMRVADLMRIRGTMLVILHDGPAEHGTRSFFSAMARRTGGCVLPFDASSSSRLAEILASVSTYALGGMQALRKRAITSTGAALLLGHVTGNANPG